MFNNQFLLNISKLTIDYRYYRFYRAQRLAELQNASASIYLSDYEVRLPILESISGTSAYSKQPALWNSGRRGLFIENNQSINEIAEKCPPIFSIPLAKN